MASPAKRTTRPQDLKFVADPNNAQSYDEMKQAASTVESQVNQLKLIVHKALGGGDFDAALKARKELEGEWWDTKEQMESHKIVSYQQADVYIKRAASRMSTHRKWYATQNKRANKTIEDALEELRLASLVLQQKQQEEEQSSEALSKASVQLTKSVRAEGAAIQRLRADLDPIVAAVSERSAASAFSVATAPPSIKMTKCSAAKGQYSARMPRRANWRICKSPLPSLASTPAPAKPRTVTV